MATKDPFRTFEGVSLGGVRMAQHWVDLIVWEAMLNTHGGQCVGIMELGTWTGGFSAYLETQARMRGWWFETYDVKAPSEYGDSSWQAEQFEQRDVFADADLLRSRIVGEGSPFVMFCDNGNKPRELAEFTEALPEHSLVAVHDWGTETLKRHIPSWLTELETLYLDEMRGITRWFVR